MDPRSFARPLVTSLLTLTLALGAFGCDRKPDPPGAKGEPLARGVAAQPAAPTPKSSPNAPAPAPVPEKQSATPITIAPRAGHQPLPSSPSDVGSTKSRPSADGVTIKRLVVTRAIQNREPAETAAITASSDPVFAFVELENKSEETATVFVTFERDGKKSVGNVKLEIPAKQSRWRTWGQTRFIREAGSWRAVVRTPEGAELARKEFEVGAE